MKDLRSFGLYGYKSISYHRGSLLVSVDSRNEVDSVTAVGYPCRYVRASNGVDYVILINLSEFAHWLLQPDNLSDNV